MNARMTPKQALAHLLDSRFLLLLLGSYALAALFPAWGVWMRDARPLSLLSVGGRSTPALPSLLLGFLLLHAGLRVRRDRICRIARRPTVLLAGLAANLAVPVLYLIGLTPLLQVWHNPSESATIVVGLALVAAMPVAGSSTGWAQLTNGDMALSLGLVLCSTLLSPLTTPLALTLLGVTAPAGYADLLHRMADWHAGRFLAAWVLLPSLCGMALPCVFSRERVIWVQKRTKPLSAIVLLLLCYANAATCLPQALRTPDWDFLIMMIGCVLGLCVLTFSCGYLIGRALGANLEQRAALMFGLGMSNNGTGQVLASITLASHPLVLLPIIAYNLSQHLVAGCVHAWLRRNAHFLGHSLDPAPTPAPTRTLGLN
jgi:BASS family bile acid:Na+ symporter